MRHRYLATSSIHFSMYYSSVHINSCSSRSLHVFNIFLLNYQTLSIIICSKFFCLSEKSKFWKANRRLNSEVKHLKRRFGRIYKSVSFWCVMWLLLLNLFVFSFVLCISDNRWRVFGWDRCWCLHTNLRRERKHIGRGVNQVWQPIWKGRVRIAQVSCTSIK